LQVPPTCCEEKPRAPAERRSREHQPRGEAESTSREEKPKVLAERRSREHQSRGEAKSSHQGEKYPTQDSIQPKIVFSSRLKD